MELKLPPIWTDETAKVGRVKEEKRREEKRREEKRRRQKSQKKEDAGARKGMKVAIHCVFRMSCGSGVPEGRKVGSLMWRVWSHLAR